MPSLCRLDAPSLAAFKTLVFGPAGAPALWLGWVDDVPAPEQDERGLTWGYAPAELDALALGVQQLPGAVTGDARADGADTPRGALVHQDASPLGDEPEPPENLEALRRAFASFAFTAALRLGLALEAGGLVTDDAGRADLHAIIALSAHNRQFSGGGNKRLAAFIEGHLLAALRHEARPAERSALFYRLGVTRGRRLHDADAGLACVEQALANARQSDHDPAEAAYQRAWALNLRAYLRLRQRDLRAALGEAEAALEALLSSAPPPASSRAWRERTLSRAVLLSNLASLANLSGARASYARRRRDVAALTRATPGMGFFRSLDLVALHRRGLQPDAALEHAREGLRAAQAARDFFWEHAYLRHVADLHSALGDAHRAARFWSAAAALKTRLREASRLPSVELALVAALRRAGRVEQARARLVAARATATGAERAEVEATLGEWAAEAAQASQAERHVNAAVELAVESGARPTLARVALAAARASARLGRAEVAREAYARAETLLAGAPPSTLALERLAARLGLAEMAPDDDDAREQALSALASALDEGEAWWLLPRVVALALALPRRRLVACAELPALCVAAAQRADCAEGVAALQAVLGESELAVLRAAWLEANAHD